MDIKVYKIKNGSTGLFSTGGTDPSWTKRGKTWSQLNHVKSHLRQFCSNSEWVQNEDEKHMRWQGKLIDRWKNNIPKEWQLVELSQDGIKETSARNLYPETE